MKKFTKIIAFILAIALLTCFFTACSKTGKCDDCHQVEPLRKYVEKDGDVRWYCSDCYKLAKAFGEW